MRIRTYVMILLILSVILYYFGIIELSNNANYIVSLSILCFSISLCFDTYEISSKKHIEVFVRHFFEFLSLAIIFIFPMLRENSILNYLLINLNTNVILLMSAFFTLAGQWATCIKLKAIEKRKRDNYNGK